MNRFLLILLFLSTTVLAQIKGTVSDKNGNPLPFVNIFLENTYTGTSTNEQGKYELYVNQNLNEYIVVFQYLGFQTHKEIVQNIHFPYTLDVTLQEENMTLNEVVVTNGENPANDIIRKAIANKKKNTLKTDKFEADFYSKGIFKAKNIPKKFMGVDIGDLDGSLDSTRSGVIYLSETVSKIKFEKPDNLKEEIIASKVAGDDNGFSYNTAMSTDYDFYQNYIKLSIEMVSPLANNAFNYYKYQLEATFYDNRNQLINKIRLTPKRDKEPVFEGYIYIVEDSWAIYGVDVDVKGYRMQEPILETLNLKQNFSFNSDNNLWVKNVQAISFDAGIFGMNFTGKFTHVFTNYNFKDSFDKKTFGKEIVSFAENSNKKDNTYWEANRQVPLTEEEITNYVKKDSIQTVRKSKTYLDSIDAKGNRFKPLDVLMGYTYKNSFHKWSFSYNGLSDITSLAFNTVQGWNLDTGFSFRKWNEETGKYTSASSTFNYGFAEDRLRVKGNFYHRFNNTNDLFFAVSGGSDISQINNANPISGLINSVSSLFFKNNYMKLYNKEFFRISAGEEVTNGLFVTASLDYENRRPLFNNTDQAFVKSSDSYFSNDPLQPFNEFSVPFEKHHLMKASLGTRIRFGQKYISRPNAKINVQNSDYPVLFFNYTKAFSASEKNYEFDLLTARMDYNQTFGNKGDFGLRMKAGKFFNADGISFIDYKHFNGNQTHINMDSDYLNSFNLLPYYTQSTNDAYIEMHLEHNFKGFIMNKIPLLNKLQWNLIGTFHQINVPDRKPYQEVGVGFGNIGFGKFRFLRVDYVRAYQGGFVGDGFMFGLQF